MCIHIYIYLYNDILLKHKKNNAYSNMDESKICKMKEFRQKLLNNFMIPLI